MSSRRALEAAGLKPETSAAEGRGGGEATRDRERHDTATRRGERTAFKKLN